VDDEAAAEDDREDPSPRHADWYDLAAAMTSALVNREVEEIVMLLKVKPTAACDSRTIRCRRCDPCGRRRSPGVNQERRRGR